MDKSIKIDLLPGFSESGGFTQSQGKGKKQVTKNEIKDLLYGIFLTEPEHGTEQKFDTVCACDMMSELLSIMNCDRRHNKTTFLLTNLSVPQVVRSCDLVDIRLVIFVGDKKPQIETLELARDCSITLMTTPLTMFKSCGLLYESNFKDVGEAAGII